MQVSTMQTMIQPESQKRLGVDEEYTHYVPDTTSGHRSPSEYYHNFSATSDSSLDDFIAQSWIPEPLYDLSWNNIRDVQTHWPHTTSLSSQDDFSTHHGQTLTYPLSSTDSAISIGHSYDFDIASKVTCGPSYQPCTWAVNHIAGEYGHDYPSQTLQVAVSSHHKAYPRSMNTILPSNASDYTELSIYDGDLNLATSDATWIPFTPDPDQDQPRQLGPIPTVPSRTLKLKIKKPSPAGLALDWSTSQQPPETFTKQRKSSLPSAPKRKYTSPRPAAEEAQSDCHLEECVGVFENAPGALATVKKRKKLDAPVRKAARDVRKAGACHQCRFRKRTVSAFVNRCVDFG